MATNIRSIASGITPQLIAGNIIYSSADGNTYLQNNTTITVNKYYPPICIVRSGGVYIFGHIILDNYNYIMGTSSTATRGYTYTFMDITNGTLTQVFSSGSYGMTATIPSNLKNGNPYLLIYTNASYTSALSDTKILYLTT